MSSCSSKIITKFIWNCYLETKYSFFFHICQSEVPSFEMTVLSVSSSYGGTILDECRRLRRSLIPISEKNCGLLHHSYDSNTIYPFVLLLGNHSSGKSSFINYMVQRKIQATGVAPTDDCFSIIAAGDEDIDRNGPALVGDPDLGFR